MDFDLPALLAAHRDDGYELYGRYLNPQQPKVLHAIGFDKVYERAEGAYLYDADGNPYADFLAGFGVFAAGPQPPGDPPGAARRAGRPAGRLDPVRLRPAAGTAGREAAGQGARAWTGCSSATAAPRRSSPR